MSQVRSIFSYALEAELIDRPVKFGPGFRPPSKRAIQRIREAAGPKLFDAAEINALLKAADPAMRAIVLLAVNCGFGNTDLATLPINSVDLARGWHSHARPKTGQPRRCPLWPETVAAIAAWLAERPQPADSADADLVFLDSRRRRLVRMTKRGHKDRVTVMFRHLCDSVDLYRPGRGLYTLRHVTETIGGETADQVAVNAIMGHVDGTMAGQYRERISDERLRRVTDHIREWLFVP
jgi:integrase